MYFLIVSHHLEACEFFFIYLHYFFTVLFNSFLFLPAVKASPSRWGLENKMKGKVTVFSVNSDEKTQVNLDLMGGRGIPKMTS